jgi:hypothetical protein
MIAALAGRRVDALDAKEHRFSSSPANINRVRHRIRTFFISQGLIALVCSAACGADLLALSEAGSLGLRRKIILPFGRAKFRSTSVIDRPGTGNWDILFDTALREVESQGDLLVMRPKSEDSAYVETNHRIIREALLLGRDLEQPVVAVRVWEGQSRGTSDLTEEFGIYAERSGLPVMDVMTI